MNKVLKGHTCMVTILVKIYFANKAFKMINRNDCQLLSFMQDKEFTVTQGFVM